MVQDFAKIRASSAQEKVPAPAPYSWAPLLTGLVAGLALGVFLSFMAYVSGIVPAVETAAGSTAPNQQGDQAAEEAQLMKEDLERAAARLQLEFYQTLPNYEVIVDTTANSAVARPSSSAPAANTTALTSGQNIAPSAAGYLIQAGAYQQETSANQQSLRLQALGLDARVKKEALLGKTLFLVQAGPYQTREELSQIERLLRSNNIDSMRITLGGL
ncbi:MAG: SPOR domain-containing protein [Pseudomonadales bacterium]|nr:SPOR domain-containing protein [Pseudomonadales bacterium]